MQGCLSYFTVAIETLSRHTSFQGKQFPSQRHARSYKLLCLQETYQKTFQETAHFCVVSIEFLQQVFIVDHCHSSHPNLDYASESPWRIHRSTKGGTVQWQILRHKLFTDLPQFFFRKINFVDWHSVGIRSTVQVTVCMNLLYCRKQQCTN